jgi:hypothetical protein
MEPFRDILIRDRDGKEHAMSSIVAKLRGISITKKTIKALEYIPTPIVKAFIQMMEANGDDDISYPNLISELVDLYFLCHMMTYKFGQKNCWLQIEPLLDIEHMKLNNEQLEHLYELQPTILLPFLVKRASVRPIFWKHCNHHLLRDMFQYLLEHHTFEEKIPPDLIPRILLEHHTFEEKIPARIPKKEILFARHPDGKLQVCQTCEEMNGGYVVDFYGMPWRTFVDDIYESKDISFQDYNENGGICLGTCKGIWHRFDIVQNNPNTVLVHPHHDFKTDYEVPIRDLRFVMITHPI